MYTKLLLVHNTADSNCRWLASRCHYWRCRHSLRSRVHVTLGRPSVLPCILSIDSSNSGRRVCCWAPCGQDISIDSCERDAGVVLQAPELSSTCGQRHVESRRRRLNTDLVSIAVDSRVWRLYCSPCSFQSSYFCLISLNFALSRKNLGLCYWPIPMIINLSAPNFVTSAKFV